PFEQSATRWDGFETSMTDTPPDGPVILDVSYKTPDLYADIDQGPGKQKGDYTVVLQVRDAKDQAEVLQGLQAKPDEAVPADSVNPVKAVELVTDADGQQRSALVTTQDGQVFTIRVEVASLEHQTRVQDLDGIATGSHEGYNYKNKQIRQEDQVSVNA